MHSPTTRRCLPARPTEEAERRERAIRTTFVNAASALGCRPQPRSMFDKPASDESRRPWRGFAEPLRACAIEASKRDRATQDLTEERIIAAVLALMHYVLEPIDTVSAEDVTYLGVAKEVPEAVEAITAAKLSPTPDNLAAADREVSEATRVLQLYQGGLRRHDYMRPRGATPLGVA